MSALDYQEVSMKDVLEQATITMPVKEAREKVAEYLASVRERHDAEEAAILRGYRALARGRQVIDLPAVIRAGGVHEEDGLPRLAVATSSHQFVHARRNSDGSVTFQPDRWINDRRRRDVYRMPTGTLPERDPDSVVRPNRWTHPWMGQMRAMVPPVPPALRPKFSLDGHATLFEVDRWEAAPRPPGDPALLKHIGGDLYAVLATWDLTPLEQAVLNGRIRS